MSALKIPHLKAVSVLRPLSSGKTKPCLMLCKDDANEDHEVVIKWRAGLDSGATGLICELMASLLATDLDLPVPKPSFVEIEHNFHESIPAAEISKLAKGSVGLNFGSQRLPEGVGTWPRDKPVPQLLRPLAAEIFAFDVLVQNPDRRRDNPNLLWSGDEIHICDHEQAFSFLMGVIGWQPPWTRHGLDFFRNHVFYQQLNGIPCNWDRLLGALEAVTDERLAEYIATVPSEWIKFSDAAKRISDYIREARQNRGTLFSTISQILQ